MATAFDEWQRGLNDRGLAIERALELAHGDSLWLRDVEYSGNGELVFVFNRDLKSLDEAWRHLFGVGRQAVDDPDASRWYAEHPEMKVVAANCRRAGNRFIISQGAEFAYAQLRGMLFDVHPFLSLLARDLEREKPTRGQQAFAPCFVKRFETENYVSCLSEQVRTHWNKLTSSSLFIGGITRPGLESPQPVQPLDRLRVLAVLSAWAQGAVYMDSTLVSRCQDYRPRVPEDTTRPFTTESCDVVSIGAGDVSAAQRLLAMAGFHKGAYPCVPTPGAVVRFRDVFQGEADPESELRDRLQIYGNNLGSQIPDINRFFTDLLEWDTRHCYGLLFRLRQQKILALQNGTDLPVLERAAWRWVHQQYQAGQLPYSAYPIIDDDAALLDRIDDLSYPAPGGGPESAKI